MTKRFPATTFRQHLILRKPLLGDKNSTIAHLTCVVYNILSYNFFVVNLEIHLHIYMCVYIYEGAQVLFTFYNGGQWNSR